MRKFLLKYWLFGIYYSLWTMISTIILVFVRNLEIYFFRKFWFLTKMCLWKDLIFFHVCTWHKRGGKITYEFVFFKSWRVSSRILRNNNKCSNINAKGPVLKHLKLEKDILKQKEILHCLYSYYKPLSH